MSDAAAAPGPIQTFTAVIGAAIGGPTGAVIGGLVGLALDKTLPTLSDVAIGVLGNLATPPVEQIIRRVRHDPQISHDLQVAYRDAVRAALADIGGRECFPDAWRTGRPVPNGVVYPRSAA